jgi:NAD(P)H-dependent flavin oxidoreductase YrpB (nitropropane dioxygenase family)
MHKELLVSAGFDDVARTVIYTGRPMRVRKTPYVANWYDSITKAFFPIQLTIFTSRENDRQAEIRELTSKGIIPVQDDLEKHPEKSLESR